MTRPKILLIDIETSPNTAYVWGLWGENIPLDRLIESSEMICFSAKWFGDDTINTVSLSTDTKNALLTKLWNLLNEADIVIHYNGKRFDIPVMNTEFLRRGFPPPSPYKQIDLYEVMKRKFRFTSNKLDHVTKNLGLAQKGKVGFEVWVGCMHGDKDAWAKMEEYNSQDVAVLEELYRRVIAWIPNHPNVGVYRGASVCPACGSHHVQRRGTVVATVNTYQRYHCTNCGKWFRDNVLVKDKKTEYRNVVGY